MTVKIVTDSSADLPTQLIQQLGITVVPLYVRFGEKVYRDRVDISEDEFYQRLLHDPIHPSTFQPTPQNFAKVYQKLSREADGIVSIHISAKLSGTYNSALQGKEMIEKVCPIEIIDSKATTIGLGLIDIVAATMAKAGESLDKVVEEVKRVIPNIRFLAIFDTLKYLLLGGRIGKAKALLGSILNVKPLLTMKEGEVMPAGQVRSRAKGLDRLFNFVKSVSNIQDLAIAYNTTPDEAQALRDRISTIFTKQQIKLARIGPMLGAHMGPGALVVALRQE